MSTTYASTEPAEAPRRHRLRALPTSTHAPAWKERRWSSRALHGLGEVVAHPAIGITAAALVLGWGLIGAVFGFPDWWATVLYSTTASVTFVMVFVIQHTQARQTAATQLKLDELIRASSRADDGFIAVEEAPEAHLTALTEMTVAEREWS